jgi:acyl carrier protein
MCARDRLLAVTTLSFDIAGFEIFLPLSLGASLEIASREVSTDGSQLLAKLISSGATVMQATPTTWRMLLEAGWQGSGELKVLCGGEVLSRKLAEELLQKTGSLWNGYGPTETTIYSVISKVEHGQGAVSIGRPIANTQIFILDKLRQPAPIGVAGELHIGGEGLARGYLNRPELSAEKFIANPFSHGPEARLYKTGDLARYLPSGDIDFLGRIDNQVKVRGFRIELGEIEAVLRQHPAVSEVVVTVREDSPEDQSLVAYFVPAQKSASKVSELRRFLKQKLPDYMVPASYRRLEQLPLLPSGKVDRKAVLAAGAVALSDYDGLAPPRTDVERKLAAMWQEVLKLEQVGIDQNFFELGGHSLRALQVMARIRSIFDVELPVRSLFEESTIAGLAAEVEKAQKLGLKARTPILPRRARTAAPSAEALLDQLDNLSATELQSLLQRVLDGKQPAS